MGRPKGSKNKIDRSISFKCAVCNVNYNTSNMNRKFCSRKCSAKSRVEILRERSFGNKWGSLRIITEEYREKMSEIHKGKKRPKSSLAKMGNKNPNWKGGISPENKRIRMSADFKDWRKKVFERDNYTCQECKQKGGELHPDHIKQFAYFPELRFELSNGRTLCRKCHLATPTWGFKKSLITQK